MAAALVEGSHCTGEAVCEEQRLLVGMGHDPAHLIKLHLNDAGDGKPAGFKRTKRNTDKSPQNDPDVT